MKKYALFLPVLALVLGFISTAHAKMFFITLPSLQQTEIAKHKNHCSYYALHAASTAVEFINEGGVRLSQAARIEALQALEKDRSLFAPHLADWERHIFASRKSLLADSPPLDFVGTPEIIKALVPNDPKLSALQAQGQLVFLDAATPSLFLPFNLELEKSFVAQVRLAIHRFRAGFPVGVVLAVPNTSFAYPVEVISSGTHAISLTLIPIGDDVEIY